VAEVAFSYWGTPFRTLDCGAIRVMEAMRPWATNVMPGIENLAALLSGRAVGRSLRESAMVSPDFIVIDRIQ
jgi:hypothetical protein